MKKRVNLQQIASELNVTPMTISRALNNKPGVSATLKEKIITHATEKGYITKEKSTKQLNIALLVAEVFIKTNNRFYIDFYKNMLNHLEDMNALGILKIIEESDVEQNIIPKILHENHVDGVIILGELPTPYIKNLSALPLPIILLDFYDEDLSLDAVISDNFFESYELTHYLIKRGHKDIAFVGNITSTHSIQDRYLGYYKATLRANLPIKEGYIISDRTKNGVFKELTLPSPLPSAFVCNCDEVANRLINQLHSQNISVPETCSVVSFDNSKFSTESTPQITTMSTHLSQMVDACTNILFKRIQNPALEPTITAIKGSIIERDSVFNLC